MTAAAPDRDDGLEAWGGAPRRPVLLAVVTVAVTIALVAARGGVGLVAVVPGLVAVVAALLGWPARRGVLVAAGTLLVAGAALVGLRTVDGSLAVLVAAVVVVAGAAWALRARAPIWVQVAAVFVAVLFAGLAVAGGVSVARAAVEVRDAAEDLRDARTLLVDGERPRAETRLSSAQRRLASAEDHLHGVLGGGFARLPGIGAYRGLLVDLVDSGQGATDSLRRLLAASGDGSLRDPAGGFDLDAFAAVSDDVDRIRAELLAMEAAIDRRRGDVWFPDRVVTELDEAADELIGASDDLATLHDLTRQVPELLGRGGPTRWLVAVLNPAELRGRGGIAAVYVELEATDGRLGIVTSGRFSELPAEPIPAEVLTEDEAWRSRWMRWNPDRFLMNATLSPDGVRTGEVLAHGYAAKVGRPIDIVLLIDPTVLARLLPLTGPIPLGDGGTLTEEDAIDLLLRRQYEDFDLTADDRDVFLALAAQRVFEEFTSDLPDPLQVARALRPAVAQARLSVWLEDDDRLALACRVRICGATPPVAGDELWLTNANMNANKIDVDLERELSYRVQVDREGVVTSEVVVTLTNLAAVDDPRPDYVVGNLLEQPRASNTTYLSLYTPLELAALQVGGVPVEAEAGSELGRNTYSAVVTVLPSSSVEVVFSLRGEVPMPDGRYRLTVRPQPSVRADQVEVHVADAREVTAGREDDARRGGLEEVTETTVREWELR